MDYVNNHLVRHETKFDAGFERKDNFVGIGNNRVQIKHVLSSGQGAEKSYKNDKGLTVYPLQRVLVLQLDFSGLANGVVIPNEVLELAAPFWFHNESPVNAQPDVVDMADWLEERNERKRTVKELTPEQLAEREANKDIMKAIKQGRKEGLTQEQIFARILGQS